MKKIILLIIFTSLLSVSAEIRITEIDIHNRELDENFFCGKTAEMLVYFTGFQNRDMRFRSMNYNNVTLFITSTEVLNMPYESYKKLPVKSISGFDFESYGEINPGLKVEDIIRRLSYMRQQRQPCMILRFKIIDFKRILNGDPYWDNITIAGEAIKIVI